MGTIDQRGNVQFEAGSGGPPGGRGKAQQAIKKALPDEKLNFLGGEEGATKPDSSWANWDWGAQKPKAPEPEQWNFASA